MLNIDRALLTNPDVLILDEATEGLAPLFARDIWRICELIQDTDISSMIVDKNHQYVSQITDRNVILVKGKVVFEGTSTELHARPELPDKSSEKRSPSRLQTRACEWHNWWCEMNRRLRFVAA